MDPGVRRAQLDAMQRADALKRMESFRILKEQQDRIDAAAVSATSKDHEHSPPIDPPATVDVAVTSAAAADHSGADESPKIEDSAPPNSIDLPSSNSSAIVATAILNLSAPQEHESAQAPVLPMAAADASKHHEDQRPLSAAATAGVTDSDHTLLPAASASSKSNSVTTVSQTSPPKTLHSQPSSVESDQLRVADLLLYYRELSDHIVREDSKGWVPGFSGVLVTEWQPESRRYMRPFSLVWLYDSEHLRWRNDNQELPSHTKLMPLLPHWTFGVDGDGDCVPRSLVMSDSAGSFMTNSSVQPIWDAVLALSRDPVWGRVRSEGKETEDSAITRYRQAFCNTMSPKMGPALEALMSKPKSMPPVESILPFASIFHEHSVRSASFDLMHDIWAWDRTFPRGVIVAENNQLNQEPVDYEQPQVVGGKNCRTIVLQYLEGTRCMAQWDGDKQVSGYGSPTCGHTDVLIPAPDMLLISPSHPLFPMEPATWIPFAAVKDVDRFITPYHRGLFGTLYSHSVYGPVQLSATPREPLFRPGLSKGPSGPFFGVVYYGSVVSYSADSVNDSANSSGQGVVVLTYVRQHSRLGQDWLRELAKAAMSHSVSNKLPTAVDAAFSAMPALGPVPYLAVWPLLPGTSSSETSSSGTTCWQQLAPASTNLRHIRSADITRVWKVNELGGLSAMTGGRLANLIHRMSCDTKPIQLENPAQPTLLRTLISQPHVQKAVEDFVRTATPVFQSDDGGVFLRWIRSRALGGFPVTALLNVRAVINCAQPLAVPGRLFDPSTVIPAQAATSAVLSTAAAATSITGQKITSVHTLGIDAEMHEEDSAKSQESDKPKKTPRNAAIVAQKITSAQAAMEIEAGMDNQNSPKKQASNKSKKSAPRKSAVKPKADAEVNREPLEAVHVAAAAKPRAKSKSKSKLVAASTSSDSEATVSARMKLLFMALADPMQPENLAPLSAFVWNNWTSDEETPYSATLGGHALAAALDSWKEAAFAQLEEHDEQLFQFLLDQAKRSSQVDAEHAVAMLGSRGGIKTADWRGSYKKLGWKTPKKSVQFLWSYSKGEQPKSEESIFMMHCSGVWYGKRLSSAYKIEDSSPPPSPKFPSNKKGKRKSNSKRGNANEDFDAEEDPEETVDLITPPGSGARNKRQKIPLQTDAIPPAIAETSTPSRTPTRSSQVSVPPPLIPVSQITSRPTTQPIATPVAASAAVAPAAATSSTVVAQLSSAPVPVVQSGEMITSVTAVLQAMQSQQVLFLEAQARSEERAAASHRASTEAQMEMVRLAQAGQQTVIDLVHSVVPMLQRGNMQSPNSRQNSFLQQHASQHMRLMPARVVDLDSDGEMDQQLPTAGLNGFGMNSGFGMGSMMGFGSGNNINPQNQARQQQMMQQHMMNQMQQMMQQQMQMQQSRGDGSPARLRGNHSGRRNNRGASGLGGGMGGMGFGHN